MPASPLGEFEVLILLAVLRLGPGAYPMAVRAEIERRTSRPTSRGAVYVTLDRLETKRLLASCLDSSRDDHARPRRAYAVTQRGVAAVRRALAALDDMRAGLDAQLERT